MALMSRAQVLAAGNRTGVKWPIGCFNRPWSRWTYDEALEGITAAGFRLTGFLGDHADEPFTFLEISLAKMAPDV